MNEEQVPTKPTKKKHFKMLDRVKSFMRVQPDDVKREFAFITEKLEWNGKLYSPYGEKVDGKGLFAIRIMESANVRVFYVYGRDNYVFGIHGYVKKTTTIPKKELKEARRALRELILGGFIR